MCNFKYLLASKLICFNHAHVRYADKCLVFIVFRGNRFHRMFELYFMIFHLIFNSVPFLKKWRRKKKTLYKIKSFNYVISVVENITFFNFLISQLLSKDDLIRIYRSLFFIVFVKEFYNCFFDIMKRMLFKKEYIVFNNVKFFFLYSLNIHRMNDFISSLFLLELVDFSFLPERSFFVDY